MTNTGQRFQPKSEDQLSQSPQAIYMREWRKNNIERARSGESASKKRRTKAMWDIILNEYGALCSCCGETRRRFLTLEHLNQDGKQHRKNRSHATGVYKDVIDQGFPKDKFAVMCLNCNWARRFGPCPHELERQGIVEAPFKYVPYKRAIQISPEGRAAITAGVQLRHTGVPKSPEQKAKIRESLKQYWASLDSVRKAEIESQTLRRRWS
jgi:hypothetical protein